MGKIFLISGGCRSGKSKFALDLAAPYKKPFYLATAQIYDDEMEARVERHKEERNNRFQTIEEPYDVLSQIQNLQNADLLLWDCLTLWLSNLLCRNEAPSDILEKLDHIVQTLKTTSYDSIIVTNEVGMGVVPESKLGRQFRDLTGFAHQMISPIANDVFLVSMGIPLSLKKLGFGHA